MTQQQTDLNPEHWFSEKPHYGVQVDWIGEDGDMIVLGHHADRRRVLAEINRRFRTEMGYGWAEDLWMLPHPARDLLDRMRNIWAYEIHTEADADTPCSDKICHCQEETVGLHRAVNPTFRSDGSPEGTKVTWVIA